MENMFCFQCEQTAGSKGCTKVGVCGKSPQTSNAQDLLSCSMVNLAITLSEKNIYDNNYVDLIVDGLFTTVTNVSFDTLKVNLLTEKINNKIILLGGKNIIMQDNLFKGDADIVSLRSTLLFGLRGMSAYAHHARVLGMRDAIVDSWFIKGMASLAKDLSVEDWLSLLMEFGQINYTCMKLLDKANTSSYGNPEPIEVSLSIEKGPFIVITGHDLRDIKMLLEQTKDKGINVYTHSEMLPAHGYPELKKYTHLKGNFGTAWQNQQKEFENIPAPIIFTTNCLMPPKATYLDNVYTTSLVAFENVKHIEQDSNGNKDFSQVINKAIELGGYANDVVKQGINGGKSVMTGFGRKTILDNAPQIIDAVKGGKISHFFLIGGCDGAKSGRNYYTEFAEITPEDSLILTLACGKFRINDLNLGKIGDFPRILDMGQCNDAYGAIEVAIALSKAFECDINQLPLTLVLSWYEQKAVCILLTLLSLGVKNIYIGPSIPAFFSDNVLSVLVDKFHLNPISNPQKDLNKILNKI